MAVTAFRADLAFSSAFRRDQVRANVVLFFAGKSMLGEALAIATTDLPLGPNGLVIDVRMRNAGDADDLLARIVAVASGARKPVAGSTVRTHPCSHDAQNPSPCPIPTERRRW